MNKKRRDSLPFPLFMAIALVAGILFFLWGQSNTAATVYELGFLRYRSQAQLGNMAEWALTEEEQAALDAAGAEAEAWAAALTPAEGTFTTETAAERYGEGARITLSYRWYDRGTGKTVILLHGYQDGEAPDISDAPKWWERGWGVLIPAQRGYGEPGDVNRTPVTYGVYEACDLYDLILAAGLGSETVIVRGKGSGAAAALLLAGDGSLAGAGLDGVVAESCYNELGDLQRSLLKKLFRLGDWFVGRFLRSRIRSSLGFDSDGVSITAAAAQAGCPVLFLCGSQETLPGEAQSRALYEACASEKALTVIPDASYRALRLTEEYFSAVEGMFP